MHIGMITAFKIIARKSFTYISLSSTVEPFSFSIAALADSSDSNWTKPCPLLFPSSDMATLQDNTFPNFWNISWSFGLSIDSLKFYNKTQITFSTNPNHRNNGPKSITVYLNHLYLKKKKQDRYLNIEIAFSALSCIRIAMWPHDSNHFSIQCSVILCFNCTNCYSNQKRQLQLEFKPCSQYNHK